MSSLCADSPYAKLKGPQSTLPQSISQSVFNNYHHQYGSHVNYQDYPHPFICPCSQEIAAPLDYSGQMTVPATFSTHYSSSRASQPQLYCFDAVGHQIPSNTNNFYPLYYSQQGLPLNGQPTQKNAYHEQSTASAVFDSRNAMICPSNTAYMNEQYNYGPGMVNVVPVTVCGPSQPYKSPKNKAQENSPTWPLLQTPSKQRSKSKNHSALSKRVTSGRA